MDIQIGELNTSIETVEGHAAQATVDLVLKALKNIQARQAALKADLDTRSIVEQQRGDQG